MIKILNAAALASAPQNTKFESRINGDKLCWGHVVNLSPYAFELQDDSGEVRDVVRWWGESICPLRVRSEYLVLVVIGTTSLTAPLPAGNLAVYIDVVDQKPEQDASLYT